MRKLFAVLLGILIVLGVTACSSEVQEETPEEVLQEQEEQNTVLANISEDKYLNGNGEWVFVFEIKNIAGEDLFIKYLTIEDIYIDGKEEDIKFTPENDSMIFESMTGIDFETGALKQGSTLFWGDGHPGESLLERTYYFVFESESGEEYKAIYKYNLIMEVGEKKMDVPADEEKDLTYILHNADFEVEVAKGVFWVPMNTLGKSDITNDEIAEMLDESPEVKQEKIDTLYEALQLFRIGEFYFSDDNIRIEENGINWEHHKPGYNAVITNNGCCATCSNWLNYILKDDYDEIGFIDYSSRDGSGHAYNYIKHDGWYYFIDMTHQTAAWEYMALESGNMEDFYSSDYALGNLLKAKSVEDYVNYLLSVITNNAPGIVFMYTAENNMAIDGLHEGDTIIITYETVEGVELNVVYDDPDDKLFWQQVPSPTKYPKW